MFKSIYLILLILFLSIDIKAQRGIGVGCGSAWANVYDERLSPEIYSGRDILWSMSFISKKKQEFDLGYLSAILAPSNKGLLSVLNQYAYQNARISYLNMHSILDSLKLPIHLDWGWVADLHGRYCKQDIASTILPYDQTLYSFQVAVGLGMHLDIAYQLNQSQNIRLRCTALIVNTGFNNPYSPHDNWYLYNTVLLPKYYYFNIPFIYSYRITSKLTAQAQLETEYYRYNYQQENRYSNVSFSLGLFISI